jgi:TonB family protein
MCYSKATLVAIGFVLFWSLHAISSDVKVVANPRLKADFISAVELKNVFMAERNSLKDRSHVEPVFERAGRVHEIFLREFLGESSESLQSHYGALVFTGKSAMPKSFNTDAEVLAYVARTRGAIGYVNTSAGTEGVKVLEVVPEGAPLGSRTLSTRIEPEYPETLRQLHIGGVVRLQVTVSPQGRVESVILLGGNPILGESAIRAVQQWVYSAAPARSTLLVTLPFDVH